MLHLTSQHLRYALPIVSLLCSCADRADRDSQPAPTQPPAAAVTAADDIGSYIVDKKEILLHEAGTGYVVEAAQPSGALSVRSALQSFGGVVVQEYPLGLNNHRVIRVAGIGSRNIAALASLRATPGLTFVQPVYDGEAGTGEVLLVNRLSVRFQPGVSDAQVDSILSATGATLLRGPRPDSGSFEYLLRYPVARTYDPLRFVRELSASPLVLWADPDKIADRRPHYVPSDAYYSSQFHLKNAVSYNGVPVDINVEPAWDLTTGSTSVRIAVIDDGVDAGHAAELFTAFSGANGYDLMASLSQGDGVFAPYGNDTHGTSIAGLIFAMHNGAGVAGIAPNTRLNAARIFRWSYPYPYGSQPLRQVATDAQIASAINWAWQSVSSDVISNSWGGGAPSAAINAAITSAATLGRGGKGAVVVFSAGNYDPLAASKPVSYPANRPEPIAVAALQPSGPRALYSAQGPELDLAAPSGATTGYCVGALVSLDRWGTAGCNDFPSDQNFTSSFSGTSGAAPQVAGVAALLLSREPNLTLGEVKVRLYNSADPWGSATDYGSGKVNAGRALQLQNVILTGPASARPNTQCLWQASVSGGVPPFTYSWTINGSPVGGSSPQLVWTTGSTAFTIAVRVDGVNGASVSKQKSVSVAAGAPMCYL